MKDKKYRHGKKEEKNKHLLRSSFGGFENGKVVEWEDLSPEEREYWEWFWNEVEKSVIENLY
jgi:hypothetical protein